ncbi:MAG: hypothetical protein EB127_12360 [Alphaproteobacteria bacterium]|nr:hypothetical protein [Alphaproteobacteria bacterium]
MKQDYCNIPIKVVWRSMRQRDELVRWLEHNIDSYDYDYTQYLDTYDNIITVYFAKSKDAILFSLRWS